MDDVRPVYEFTARGPEAACELDMATIDERNRKRLQYTERKGKGVAQSLT